MSNNSTNSCVSAVADVIVKSRLDGRGVRAWLFSKFGWTTECECDVLPEDIKEEIEAHEDFCGWKEKCPVCCEGAEVCECGSPVGSGGIGILRTEVIVKSRLDDQGVRCWEFSQSGWVSECDGDVATEDQKKQIEAHEDFCGWMDKCPKCCGVAEYCECGDDCKKKYGVECDCDDCWERRAEEEGVWCEECKHFVVDDDHCCCKKKVGRVDTSNIALAQK